WQDLPSELKSFYTEINGIVAYRGGLHIRGCVSGPDWHSLRYFWKGPKALYRQFASLRENDIPFAEDCLGDQYFWRLGTVWRLFFDNGDVEDLELELYDFFEEVEKDPVDFLDLEPLVYFLDQGNEIEAGQYLVPDPPFTVESDTYAFKVLPSDQFFHDF
ncbi:MAG: hypothetical protein KDC53_20630, partial [Saprospiraceae bacterium]|nr:hypothetical protein [Saprospiraceae bacterium]